MSDYFPNLKNLPGVVFFGRFRMQPSLVLSYKV